MRFVTFISTLILMLGFGTLFLFAYWQFADYKPIVFNNIPFPVSKTQFKNGDTLSYTVDYCKHIAMDSLVTREFVNQVVYVTPSIFSNVPLGCNRVVAEIVIPESLYDGTYQLKIHYAYKVNPIRTVTVTAESQTFEIVGHAEINK